MPACRAELCRAGVPNRDLKCRHGTARHVPCRAVPVCLCRAVPEKFRSLVYISKPRRQGARISWLYFSFGRRLFVIYLFSSDFWRFMEYLCKKNFTCRGGPREFLSSMCIYFLFFVTKNRRFRTNFKEKNGFRTVNLTTKKNWFRTIFCKKNRLRTYADLEQMLI